MKHLGGLDYFKEFLSVSGLGVGVGEGLGAGGAGGVVVVRQRFKACVPQLIKTAVT